MTFQNIAKIFIIVLEADRRMRPPQHGCTWVCRCHQGYLAEIDANALQICDIANSLRNISQITY